MASNHKKPTIMIFSPHIDDVEFGLPFFYVRALTLGFNVIEVVMTNSEFGTLENEFKGKRLKRIRNYELKKSIQIFTNYTNNQTNLIYLNYIDGHLTINRRTVDQLSEIIKREEPDIILAPEPWYIIDHHSDHINTGRLVFFALKRIKSNYLPDRILYYYTFNSNCFFKVYWKDRCVIYNAYSCFQSQVTPLQRKYLKLLYRYLYCKRVYKSGFFTENFREQILTKNGLDYPKIMNLLQKFKYHFYRVLTYPKIRKFHNFTPRELGLE